MGNPGHPPEKRDPAPQQQPREPREPRAPRSTPGRSGHGADSALKHLREWEQRRGAGQPERLRDKPARR